MKVDQTDNFRDFVDGITLEANKNGKIIELGWLSLAAMCLPKDCGRNQYNDMRSAFFAGAQHLWASINSLMTEDREPTQADLDRMTRIDQELREFVKTLRVYREQEQ